MGISRTQDGIYKVKARVRIRGKIVQKQCTLTGSTREAAKVVLEKFKAELRALDTAGRSLKLKTFGEALTFYCERHEIGKSKSLFDRMQSDLGAVELRELADRFDNYLQLLKRSKAKRTGKPRLRMWPRFSPRFLTEISSSLATRTMCRSTRPDFLRTGSFRLLERWRSPNSSSPMACTRKYWPRRDMGNSIRSRPTTHRSIKRKIDESRLCFSRTSLISPRSTR